MADDAEVTSVSKLKERFARDTVGGASSGGPPAPTRGSLSKKCARLGATSGRVDGSVIAPVEDSANNVETSTSKTKTESTASAADVADCLQRNRNDTSHSVHDSSEGYVKPDSSPSVRSRNGESACGESAAKGSGPRACVPVISVRSASMDEVGAGGDAVASLGSGRMTGGGRSPVALITVQSVSADDDEESASARNESPVLTEKENGGSGGHSTSSSAFKPRIALPTSHSGNDSSGGGGCRRGSAGSASACTTELLSSASAASTNDDDENDKEEHLDSDEEDLLASRHSVRKRVFQQRKCDPPGEAACIQYRTTNSQFHWTASSKADPGGPSLPLPPWGLCVGQHCVDPEVFIVSWKTPTCPGGEPIKQYKLERSANAAFTDPTLIGMTMANCLELRDWHTGTLMFYRLVAKNAVFWGVPLYFTLQTDRYKLAPVRHMSSKSLSLCDKKNSGLGSAGDNAFDPREGRSQTSSGLGGRASLWLANRKLSKQITLTYRHALKCDAVIMWQPPDNDGGLHVQQYRISCDNPTIAAEPRAGGAFLAPAVTLGMTPLATQTETSYQLKSVATDATATFSVSANNSLGWSLPLNFEVKFESGQFRLEGPAMKKGGGKGKQRNFLRGGRRNWKQRYFVLRGSWLSYYPTKEDYVGDKPYLRELDVTTCYLDRGGPEDTSVPYCIQLRFEERDFVMAFHSEEDCDQWVNILRWLAFDKTAGLL